MDSGSAITEGITIEQLRQLVHMVDQSDTTELEVKNSSTNIHLVLRKFPAQEGVVVQTQPLTLVEETECPTEQTTYNVDSPFVGVFQQLPALKGKAPLMVGDRVKQGQRIGAVLSLNIANEIEAPVEGYIAEFLVQDGQRVEYGQPLLMIMPEGAIQE